MEMPTATILQWARKGGMIVHVSQVVSGAACECVCDKCGQALIAKKGRRRTHHFAHESADCHGNQESLMHLAAKDIICREKTLVMPDERGDVEVTFDRMAVEQRVGPYCADLVGFQGHRQYIIEIAVTHRCEPEKVQHFRSEGLDALEIYVDAKRDFMSTEEFERHVLSEASRTWISNPAQAEAPRPDSNLTVLAKIQALFKDRQNLEIDFLQKLRRAVGDKPNRLHYGTLVKADLRDHGIRWLATTCVKSPELPVEFDNTAMVMLGHKTMSRYLGRRVGFDVVYDYESSIVLDAGVLFPMVVIRWVEGVEQWELDSAIGSRRWRRKEYSWI